MLSYKKTQERVPLFRHESVFRDVSWTVTSKNGVILFTFDNYNSSTMMFSKNFPNIIQKLSKPIQYGVGIGSCSLIFQVNGNIRNFLLSY